MKVRAAFVTSAVGAEGCPADGLPEVALVGRSNVGKSTLVNALARQKVARTSAAPGKTRLINVYRIEVEGDAPFYLVDLPGYGYARGGAKSAEEFEALTRSYFADRSGREPVPSGAGKPVPSRVEGRRGPEAFAVLQLVDGRHPGLPADLGAHDWLQTLGVPLEERVLAAAPVLGGHALTEKVGQIVGPSTPSGELPIERRFLFAEFGGVIGLGVILLLRI